MISMSGRQGALSINYRGRSGKNYHLWMPLNHINRVRCSTQRFTVLGFLNRKRLIYRSSPLTRTSGRIFLLIISSLILSILLLGSHLVKLIKARYYCLEGRSFWKVRLRIRGQLIGRCRIRCIRSNRKLIRLRWKGRCFRVLGCNMVSSIQLFRITKFTHVSIFYVKQTPFQDGTITFRSWKSTKRETLRV